MIKVPVGGKTGDLRRCMAMLRTDSLPKLVILEDEEERREAMIAEVGDLSEIQFFGNVTDFEIYVRANQEDIFAISLDHDLRLPKVRGKDPTPEERRQNEAFGNGVQACEKLVDIYGDDTLPKLIIHTNNPSRRFKMLSTLGVHVPGESTVESGQSSDGRIAVTVVSPYGSNAAWISKIWGPAIRSLFTPSNDD